jgi:hypothetical protein
MGGSYQVIRNPQSSHEHGHWRTVQAADNEARRLYDAYKTRGDLIFSARRIKFTLFQAFLHKHARWKYKTRRLTGVTEV